MSYATLALTQELSCFSCKHLEIAIIHLRPAKNVHNLKNDMPQCINNLKMRQSLDVKPTLFHAKITKFLSHRVGIRFCLKRVQQCSHIFVRDY